jgi:paraquat-inducible protein A
MRPVIACEFCDLLHRPRPLRPGEKAKCSRCGGVLARQSRSPIQGTLALAFAALILLVMANIFTFLVITLEGQVSENTIATGVIGLWNGDARALALLILFTTILAPALRILGLLYVVFPLSLGRVPPGVAGAMRFQETLISWAMLDVYMLALLVILIKMMGWARIQLETGAYCFLALFIVLTLVSAFYDREALWDRVEALR